MQKELLMINEYRDFLPADGEYTRWPSDMRQTALEVIATTRYEWLSRDFADEPVAGRARFAHPLSGRAPDAFPEP